MTRYILSGDAARDLDGIWDYIAEDNVDAADRWIAKHSGLNDFLFRRYSSTQSRWISPDPAGIGAVDPTNPQTWNRYSYVANTPLSATDPTGLMMRSNGDSGEGGGGDWGADLDSGDTENPLNPALGSNQVLMDGIAVSSSVAQAALATGLGMWGPGTSVVSDGYGNAMFAIPGATANGEITWSFTDTASWSGMELSNAAIAEILGLDSDVVEPPFPRRPPGMTPGADPRLVFGSRGLTCDGRPESFHATLASTGSASPPSQYRNVPLTATVVPTPGFAGNKSLILNGSPIRSMFGNIFTQSITVSSFTTISVNWSISTIKNPHVVVAATQVAECNF